MVQHDKAGSDRHQPVAQTVQPRATTSGPEYATASTENSNQEWPRTWGLDKIIPQEWVDAGKAAVNYTEQKFKCSGCGGRASKQVRPPSGGLSNANAYQGL